MLLDSKPLQVWDSFCAKKYLSFWTPIMQWQSFAFHVFQDLNWPLGKLAPLPPPDAEAGKGPIPKIIHQFAFQASAQTVLRFKIIGRQMLQWKEFLKAISGSIWDNICEAESWELCRIWNFESLRSWTLCKSSRFLQQSTGQEVCDQVVIQLTSLYDFVCDRPFKTCLIQLWSSWPVLTTLSAIDHSKRAV